MTSGSAIIKQLLDEAMSNIKIYSVETKNIRRGQIAESNKYVLSSTP